MSDKKSRPLPSPDEPASSEEEKPTAPETPKAKRNAKRAASGPCKWCGHLDGKHAPTCVLGQIEDRCRAGDFAGAREVCRRRAPARDQRALAEAIDRFEKAAA